MLIHWHMLIHDTYILALIWHLYIDTYTLTPIHCYFNIHTYYVDINTYIYWRLLLYMTPIHYFYTDTYTLIVWYLNIDTCILMLIHWYLYIDIYTLILTYWHLYINIHRLLLSLIIDALINWPLLLYMTPVHTTLALTHW